MAMNRKRIEFWLVAPKAHQVVLSGTFNQWSESADPMKRDENGVWKKAKMLSNGEHEYKLIIDGEWMIDPVCSDTALNEYGTLNSVFRLQTL